MSDDDLRSLLNPVQAILAARPKWREVPESSWTPPATPEEPDPEPVVIPARTELYVDPADLPPEVVSQAGDGVNLGAQLALLQSMVRWLWTSQQIREATGRVTLTAIPPGTAPTWAAGESADLAVTWDATPLIVPADGDVEVDAAIAWAGKTSAVVKPGSITSTGCTITVKNISGSVVVPVAAQPITYIVRALYLYLPPYTP